MINSQGSIEDPFQNFIALSRYAKWNEELGRRETWSETIDRYIFFMENYLRENYQYDVSPKELKRITQAIKDREVLPSMRALMTAGPALEKSAVAAYNCCYVPIDSAKVFDEIMFILMNGTGVGFSVESQFVNKLPTVPSDLEDSDHTIVVADSREGWAKALRVLISTLYAGQIPQWDVSKVRKKGERLKTFGGRASGPEPLVALFEFVIDKFKKAKGRKLSSLDCHDIVCKVGEVVIAGSVRRSALISLSDLSDNAMATSKGGQFWADNAQRSMANNSAVYYGKPDSQTFLKEWLNLVESGTGERGIYNLQAAQAQAAKYGLRSADESYGTNPCSEIILRPQEFCNLTSVPIKGNETLEELKLKVEIATVLGTWQSTIDHFHYLRKEYKKNAEEERLLGVGLSGIFGHPVLNGSQGDDILIEWLTELRTHARLVNEKLAPVIGINKSAAITCIKPDGNSSQLTGVSSGIHPWHSEYYIRTVRADNKDPLARFMKDAGVPCEPDLMKPDVSDVFSFPIKAPQGAITRYEISALDHLHLWLLYQRHWCEHKPSITVSVKKNEWVEVGNWVYENFDEISGISFLPFSDHIYEQAPYQECTKEEYDEAVSRMPSVDWSELSNYENDGDKVIGGRELNCSAGSCEIIDLTS